MIDLSSTLFFKAKFEITAKQADFDLLWCIVCHIRNWMSSKWRKRGEISLRIMPFGRDGN